jgi:hypothetical protein
MQFLRKSVIAATIFALSSCLAILPSPAQEQGPSKPSSADAARSSAPAAKADSQSQTPAEPDSAPIKGFHPIKRALQPVQNLEGLGIKLEQQIMKLEGPIVSLKAPMVSLQDQMNVVDTSMLKMEKQVCGVNDQMKGVRSDLATMQEDITALKKPILSIQKPLSNLTEPLEGVKRQLNLVVVAIFAMAIGIVFGTPLAAVLTYRFRHKLFPSKVAATLPSEKELAVDSVR